MSKKRALLIVGVLAAVLWTCPLTALAGGGYNNDGYNNNSSSSSQQQQQQQNGQQQQQQQSGGGQQQQQQQQQIIDGGQPQPQPPSPPPSPSYRYSTKLLLNALIYFQNAYSHALAGYQVNTSDQYAQLAYQYSYYAQYLLSHMYDDDLSSPNLLQEMQITSQYIYYTLIYSYMSYVTTGAQTGQDDLLYCYEFAYGTYYVLTTAISYYEQGN